MNVSLLQTFDPSALPIAAGSAGPGAPRQPRSWRRMLVLAAAILALAAAGLWTWSHFMKPIAVRVAPAENGVRQQIFGLGTVDARIISNVGFKVAGVLAELSTDQGERVRRGAVLARLDTREAQAQLDAARAGVALAEASLGKARADVESAQANLTNAQSVSGRRAELARSGYASKEEAQTTDAAMRVARANLDVAGSGVAVAAAGLEAARAQAAFAQATLDNDTLLAPYDALVVARLLNPGSLPVPGQTVFSLVDPQTIWVVGYIDERLAGGLVVGQSADIVLRSRPGEHLPGRVARIEIQSDPVNQERQVEIAFDRIPADIHLAEQAEVLMTTGMLAQAVPVPPTAVTGLAGGHGTVWTLEQGHLARREVSFGRELVDGRLPVVAGLPEGARVVLAPQSGLRAGRAATVLTGAAP
jgi:HlyD family secretion protein